MRLLLASLATAIALAAPASAETRAYNLSGFSKIEASTAFQIVFTQSPTWSVVVDSRHNNLDKIIVEKVGDTLRITRPKNTHLEGEVEDIVHISAPDIDALRFNAAISFTADVLNVDTLDINANAAVTIDIANLKAGNIRIDADAATTIALTGSCTKLDLILGAASTVKAKAFRCRETNIAAGAASSVHAFASDKAIARAGVASHVLISGHPRDFQESHEKFSSNVSLAND
jgi:hypothetical protein